MSHFDLRWDANGVLTALLAGDGERRGRCDRAVDARRPRPRRVLPAAVGLPQPRDQLDVMEEFEADGKFDRSAWREALRDLARRTLDRGGISHTLILDGDRVCTLDELDDDDRGGRRWGLTSCWRARAGRMSSRRTGGRCAQPHASCHLSSQGSSTRRTSYPSSRRDRGAGARDGDQ